MLIDRYTKEKGYQLDEEFRYVDVGVSAFRGQNLKEGRLRHFIEAIREKKVPAGSVLLLESLDRLTRLEPMEAFAVFIEIINAGVKIVTLTDGIEHSKEATGQQQMLSLMMSATILCRAHEESLMKSNRLKGAWVRKRENIKKMPYTKRIPRWLELSPDGLQAVVIESKAAIVRRMFELCLAGNHAEGIARIFRKEKVPLVGGGKRWRHSYISQTLRNEAVTGQFTPHRIEGGRRVPASPPVVGYYPKIVSKAKFDRVQFIMDSRSKNKGGRVGVNSANIFKKRLFCGYCGGAMHVNYKGRYRSGENRKSLICSNAKDDGACPYIAWDYWEFEEAFLKSATELHLLLKDKFQDSGLREEIQQYEGRLLVIEKQLLRYAKMLKADDKDAPPPRLLLSGIRELEAEQDELRDKRSVAEQKMSAGLEGPHPIIHLGKLAKKMDDPSIRAVVADLISQLFKRIDVFAAGSRFDLARLMRMHKEQVRKRGRSDGSVAVYLREHFDRRAVRFFRVLLDNPSVGKRLEFTSDGKPRAVIRLDLVEDLPDDAEFAGV